MRSMGSWSARPRARNLAKQKSFLESATADPSRILGAPSRLLAIQPALRRLKDGLVDAQLRTAQLSGTRSPDHPLMKAARIGEHEVRRDLHRELHSALRGLSAEIAVTNRQRELLTNQLEDVTERMSTLAGLRARYGNLVDNVAHRSTIVAQATRSIAEARATQRSTVETSLLTQIDSPLTGSKPQGPGKTTLVLGGLAGGIAAGVGLILLLTPIVGPLGQDWSAQSFFRRRNDDQRSRPDRGRRGSDQASQTLPQADDRPAQQRQTGGPATQPAAESVPSSPRQQRGGEQRGGERRGEDRRGGPQR